MMNLDSDTTNAILALKGDQRFQAFLAAYGRMGHKLVMDAIGSADAARVSSTAYAKAHRDLYVAVATVMTSANVSRGGSQVPFPDFSTDVPGAKPFVMIDPAQLLRQTNAEVSQTSTTQSPTGGKAAAPGNPAKATK
jgi:hypothetical protein